LATPKCNRCATRGNICEYPAGRINQRNVAAAQSLISLSEPNQSQGLFELAPTSSNAPFQTRQTALDLSVPGGLFSQSHPDLSSFQQTDLIPMADAGEIRDRWLRPYVSAATGQEPKQLNPHTIQYLTCVFKAYLRNLSNSLFPPFIHYSQCTHGRSPVLSYCCANLKMWLGKRPEYEIFILGTIRDEMKKIENQVRIQSIFPMIILTSDRMCFDQTSICYALFKPISYTSWPYTFFPWPIPRKQYPHTTLKSKSRCRR
jgi:hypothetical protein